MTDDTATRTSEPGYKRRAIFVAIAIGLVAALIPIVMMLDETMDRKRPMYTAVHTMDVLQYRHVQQTGQGMAIDLHEDESATVGGREFTPPRGVSIRVRLVEDGYCIQGSNQHGDVTKWRCGDGETNPET